MSYQQKYFIKILLFVLGWQLPGLALALDTTVILKADNTISPTTNEVVTFGLPLAAGDVIKTPEIRVQIAGVEQRISVQDGLRWHWLDNSLRSVTIQLQGVNMSAGNVTLTITDAGRDTTQDIAPVPHNKGWATAGPTKGNLPFPRIFAVHDLAYLASTGIIPPYIPGSTKEGVGKLQLGQFDNNYGALDYPNSTGSSWLFDRATAMLKAYVDTGDVKFLKEGFLSKQFYYNHVRNDGAPPKNSGGSGCWTYGGVECADGKYIYTQPAKLAWALFGDNSQWDNSIIVKMALQADLGWNQPDTRSLYSTEFKIFTERGAGIVGLAEVGAYEITGDSTVLSHMKERIAALKDMQQIPKTWDTKYGWLPMSGAFTHSWQYHEGAAFVPAPDSADDRRFSPWMSENIADFLWQAYQITSDANLRSSLGEMMRQLGNAVDKYGFTSSYLAGEGVNATYTRKPGIPATDIACPAPSDAPDNLAIEVMYSGSAYASNSALAATQAADGSNVDTHNVEVILPLALAFHFETDPAARKRLLARAEHLKRQWTNNKSKNCASIFNSVAYRVFNWQHRSNSVQTWEWVLKADGVAAPLPPEPLKLSFPGYVWVSVGACADGQSWHWQCSGEWVLGSTYAAHELIATCDTSDGVTCENVAVNRRWSLTADLKLTSNVMICTTKPQELAVLTSCSTVKYVKSGASVAVNLFPLPLDQVAFDAALKKLSAVVTQGADGQMLVQVGGTLLSLRMGGGNPVDTANPVSADGSAIFKIVGNIVNPDSYLFTVTYPDGKSQDMLPYVVDTSGFDAWMQNAGFSYSFNAINGQISVRDRSDNLIWRGVPAYNITPAVVTSTVGLSQTTDSNGDGLPDVIFHSGPWNQVIFGLSL